MVTLLNSEQGTVVNLDDVQVATSASTSEVHGSAAQWYSEAGLDLD